MIVELAIVGALLLAVAVGRRGDPDGPSGGSGRGVRPRDATPSPEIETIIVAAARAYGLEPAFVLAHAAHESRFIPDVGLNTLGRTDLPEGQVPERSIGLCGVNVNPRTHVGQRRLALIKQELGLATDHEAVEALREPAFNCGFFCAHIATPARDHWRDRGLTGFELWVAVRVWMYSTGYSPTSGPGASKAELFRPTLRRWVARYPLAAQEQTP